MVRVQDKSSMPAHWNPIDGGIVLQSYGGNVKNAGWCLPGGRIIWESGET
jgi:hypothetical protein